MLRQLYYTSCVTGLSEGPGFQFNAASDGLSPTLMREIEELTGYDPPSTVPYDADATALARCPVNLSYQATRSAGSSRALANVVFVGADYSGRSGNYFAHTLVSEDIGADLGVLLPIELWRAPFWTVRPADTRMLPPLPAPPPAGPLRRADVAAFLREHPTRHELPALLTAVVGAVSGAGRPVLLLAGDSDEAAMWLAAVSFLLPADLVLGMSFSTYQRRPRPSGVHHVVATVPDPDAGSRTDAFGGFVYIDLTAGRAAHGAPPASGAWSGGPGIGREYRVEPWATLLADLGVEAAADLWARAAELLGHRPGRPEEWLGPLAAAVFRSGRVPRSHPAELAAAAARWLDASSPSSHPYDVRRIGGLLREYGEDLAGPRVLHRQRPQDQGPQDQGPQGQGPQGQGPQGQGPQGQGLDLDPDLPPLLRGWPTLREGIVNHLRRAVVSEPDLVVAALAGELGHILKVEEVSGDPGLFEAHLVARTRREPSRRAAGAVEIAGVRSRAGRSPALDEDLLTRIWPRGRWTAEEAVHLLDKLDPACAALPAPVRWLEEVLRREGAPDELPEDLGGYLRAYDRLYRLLESSPVWANLPADAQTVVRRRQQDIGRLSKQRDHRRKAKLLSEALGRSRSGGSTHLAARLAVEVDAARGEDLPGVFEACSAVALERYLELKTGSAAGGLDPERPDPRLASRCVYAQQHLRAKETGRSAGRTVGRDPTDLVRTWQRSDLRAVATELGVIDQAAADAFTVWYRLNTGSLLGRRWAVWRAGAPRRKAAREARRQRKAQERELREQRRRERRRASAAAKVEQRERNRREAHEKEEKRKQAEREEREQREKLEQEAREKAEQEARDKAAREKRDARRQAAKDKREARQLKGREKRAARKERERASREAAREKAERERRVAEEKAERERRATAEKEERERKKREAAERKKKPAEKKSFWKWLTGG